MPNPITSAGINLFSGLLSNTIKFIGYLVVAAVIIGVGWWVHYLRKFDIEVEIKSLRADMGGRKQYKIIHDKAGYIYSKRDKCWFFRLKDIKIDLKVPPFNVLMPTDKGNKIKLLQTSPDEFTFLLEDEIIEDKIIGTDGKLYPISAIKLKQVEGDVAFWNIKRKSLNKGLFNPESTLMKLLPFIVPVLMFVLVIFMTWMVLKNFSVLGDVAASLKETAQILTSSTSATVTTHNP